MTQAEVMSHLVADCAGYVARMVAMILIKYPKKTMNWDNLIHHPYQVQKTLFQWIKNYIKSDNYSVL